MTDNVNHPTHYADGWSNGAEVIDITENLNFSRGNAVKYIARAGKKDPEKELEDLQKAEFYLKREIQRVLGTAPTYQVVPLPDLATPECSLGDMIGFTQNVVDEPVVTSWQQTLGDAFSELFNLFQPGASKTTIHELTSLDQLGDGIVWRDDDGDDIKIEDGALWRRYSDDDESSEWGVLFESPGSYALEHVARHTPYTEVPAETKPEPRVWQSLSEIPEGVSVTDVDGDFWKLEGGSVYLRFKGPDDQWDNVGSGHPTDDDYAPFTEIIGDAA